VCASSAASRARFAVEYVTTIVGALVLYLLSSLGTFEFATTDASASDAERLLLLVAINVLPEVLIDSGCILTETEAGLGPMHLHYWRTMSPLTVLVKAAFCLFITAMVLERHVRSASLSEAVFHGHAAVDAHNFAAHL
jgi:hypothetical protein